MYDHLYNRNNNNIQLFYNNLQLYIKNNIVTIIEMPLVIRQKEYRYMQHSAILESTRRFRQYSAFIYFGDIDEFIIPQSIKYNVQEIYQKSLKLEQYIPIFTYQSMLALPGLQNVYNLMNGNNNVQLCMVMQDKK
jgi:hypothetical protein